MRRCKILLRLVCVTAIGVCVFSVYNFGCTHFFNWREVKNMPDYKELYFELFNKVTDIIEELEKIQCDMEEKCIEEDNDKE